MADKKCVLVVDDEKELRELLVQKLTKAGFDVAAAGDGEEGLEVAREKKPDLILLDIVMPKMDGITMLKKLREEEWGKNVEVMLLTVLEDEQHLSQALEAGAREYFVKTDWKLDDVVERVKSKLGA